MIREAPLLDPDFDELTYEFQALVGDPVDLKAHHVEQAWRHWRETRALWHEYERVARQFDSVVKAHKLYCALAKEKRNANDCS